MKRLTEDEIDELTNIVESIIGVVWRKEIRPYLAGAITRKLVQQHKFDIERRYRGAKDKFL